jgi:hypothetical protein
MKKRKQINEATLEARINEVLSKIFPTFKEVNVVHQESFSIQFGHHNVSIDLKAPSEYPVRAIFDILLTIDVKNVILLELKKEGQSLTNDNVDQAISYARLTNPMPPITLVSNGSDNWFYNTYTKERLDVTNIDIAFIQKLTDNSFQLALNDFKDAIGVLLNKDDKLFSNVINQISELKFRRLTGELNDFNKPICLNFNIERKIVSEIQTHLSQEVHLVGIIGSAFSGKTNVLYQFFDRTKSDNNYLLYFDGSDHNYSILQQLANHFTENAKILITKDKIREWLISSLVNNVDKNFYVLLDNFNNDIPEIIKSEILELIDIFKGVNQHIVYTIDEFNYKKIAYVENRRYKTIIGEQSRIVKLDELTDDEYELANRLLYENFSIVIENGGHYTPEYREPRILRHLANIYRGDIPKGQYFRIIAVPDLDHLHLLSKNKIYTKQVHELYQKISFCFLKESKIRKMDADLSMVAFGSGAITTDTFKKHFADDFEQLIKSSFIVIRELRNGMTVIYPKIPELVAEHSIRIISDEILKEKNNGKSYKEICQTLIDLVTPVTFCDLVATGVLVGLSKSLEVALFSELVQELLKIPPRYEKIKKGTKALMYSEGVGHIQINFEDDVEDGGFISNFLPYVILSQIAGYPLKLEKNEDYSEYAFHHTLLYTVGSNKNHLTRVFIRSVRNIKPLESYDWEDVGHIISGHEGIVEPFVQSIQKCFLLIPQEIKILYDRAFEENNFLLIWRIYLAIRSLTDFSDCEIANQANEFLNRFNDYFKKFMADYLSKDIKDPSERTRIREKLLKMKGLDTNDIVHVD